MREEKEKKKFPFLKYASRAWLDHVHAAEKSDTDFGRFLESGSKWPSLGQVRSACGFFYVYHSYYFHIFRTFPSGARRWYGDQKVQDITLIHLFSAFGLRNVVEVILEESNARLSKADLKDGLGRTPLLLAAECGHDATVQLLLLRYQVEADSKDERGRTPLSHAVEWGHDGIVKLLLMRDDVEADTKNEHGRTPLSFAAERGHDGIVELLLRRDDVDSNSKDHAGKCPLYNATNQNRLGSVRLLIKNDKVEISNMVLQNAFHRLEGSEGLCRYGDVVRELLNQNSVRAELP